MIRDLASRPDGQERGGDGRGLREALRETVAAHLMSEVPLGAFLSGGIDSSAVVGTMAGLMDQPVQTASIGFREDAYDELPFARRVAAAFGAAAHERTVEARAADILERLTWHYDEPFADSSMVPTWYVSQVARERVTVCLSGDGGDENFAGYRRMRYDFLENRIRARIPRWARRRVLAPVAAAYPRRTACRGSSAGRTLLTNLTLVARARLHNTMRWFTPAMKARLYLPALRASVGTTTRRGAEGSSFRPRRDGIRSRASSTWISRRTSRDDILAKVDARAWPTRSSARPRSGSSLVSTQPHPGEMKLKHGEGNTSSSGRSGSLAGGRPYASEYGILSSRGPLVPWRSQAPIRRAGARAGSYLESHFEPAAIRSLLATPERRSGSQLWLVGPPDAGALGAGASAVGLHERRNGPGVVTPAKRASGCFHSRRSFRTPSNRGGDLRPEPPRGDRVAGRSPRDRPRERRTKPRV